MHQTICFVSDFGLEDTWVGVCHAVIHAACPQAHVVDLAHQVPPFDIRKAAAIAAAGVHQLPAAIHLVVVDPGVGGDRLDLCLVAGDTTLVGPDNGVLIPAARRAGGIGAAFAIDASKIHHSPPHPTFHARDVLAPAAAALACGVSPDSLGPAVDPASLVDAPFPEFESVNGSIRGEVLESDRFGSVRFNITPEALPDMSPGHGRLEFLLGHNTIVAPFCRTFGDVPVGSPVSMVDSSGWLTLALNTDSALERYSVEPGMPVHVRAVD